MASLGSYTESSWVVVGAMARALMQELVNVRARAGLRDGPSFQGVVRTLRGPDTYLAGTCTLRTRLVSVYGAL